MEFPSFLIVLPLLWILHFPPVPKQAGWGVAVPLHPPALHQNGTVLDSVAYGAAALLDVELGGLKVRHCQNISRVWANSLLLDLPGEHACEPPRSLHVEPLQFTKPRVTPPSSCYRRVVQKLSPLGTYVEHARNARRHLLSLKHLLELSPRPLSLLDIAAYVLLGCHLVIIRHNAPKVLNLLYRLQKLLIRREGPTQDGPALGRHRVLEACRPPRQQVWEASWASMLTVDTCMQQRWHLRKHFPATETR